MTSFINFTANDLAQTFNNFDFINCATHNFTTSKIPTLKLDLDCSIAIRETKNVDRVTVKIDGNSDNLSVYQVENTIHVEEIRTQHDGNTVVQNIGYSKNSVNTVYGNASITNYADGTTTISSNSANLRSVNNKPRQVIIITPARTNLDAKLKAQNTVLVSNVSLGKTTLLLNTTNIRAIFTTHYLFSTAIGSSQISATLTGGKLYTNTVQDSITEIKGIWSEANLSIFQNSKVVTNGSCLGDYTCSMNNNAYLYRRGSIDGTYTEDLSDNAKVTIF